MKKDYTFFHNLLISWWQGTKTKNELIQQVDSILKLNNISLEYEFISQFEEAIRNYDENYYFEWLQHKEYAKDTAPTLIGLVHSIEEYKSGNLTQQEFVEWACWHNGDCGETTSGRFENKSIEYFCLFFLPNYYQNLDFNFYSKAILILMESNKLSYGEFIISLNLLLEKQKKSMYFFFKDYLDGKKSDDELNAYLEKKYSENQIDFKFDLSTFPYKKELQKNKENKEGIDALMKIMEK